ncbi:MAG: group II intron reverse transcriptase/maturase [Desulfobulbus sp.]|nr:group II intron reverse transcriptase/maturase [Desulfobulbus sp.]
MNRYSIEQIVCQENFYAAWLRVRENQGCAGVDRQTVDDFASELEHNLAALSHEILSNSYHPLPLLRAWIDKENGGQRPLAIPAVRDRVLQTAAALVLTPLFEAEFEDCSFAYRKGRSVDQAVRRVAAWRDEGFCWVVDADIHAFFDEIDHDILLQELRTLVVDQRILDLIRLWLKTDLLDDGLRLPITQGVPQGSPISPLLSNLYLDHLDDVLLANNLRLVRFADDFLVLCKSQDAAEDALELTETVLDSLRLRINNGKTRIVNFNAGFRFLGVEFIRTLVLKTREKETAAPAQPGLLPDAVRHGIAINIAPPLSAAAPAPLSDAALASDEHDIDIDIPADSDPRLRTLYLLEPGTMLGKESERFVVRKKGEILQEIPAIKVDQIMVFGNAQISTQAMHFCLLENIPICLLSGKGRFYGVVDSFATDPVLLHRDQFATADDPTFCLALARECVRGKIENARVVAMRSARRRETSAFHQAADDLKTIAAQLESATTLDQLRGFEGIAARKYFAALAGVFEPAWCFRGRVRQPPTDPVNAMLSYGYTLLFYNMYSLLRARGLNPHVGYLHPLRSGHPALVSDMIEEFRSLVVDAVVLNLVLNGKVQPQDFTFPDDENDHCFMHDNARTVFIRAFEAKMNAAVTHPVSGLHLDYRRCMEQQVRELAAVVRGRQERYRPMILR